MPVPTRPDAPTGWQDLYAPGTEQSKHYRCQPPEPVCALAEVSDTQAQWFLPGLGLPPAWFWSPE